MEDSPTNLNDPRYWTYDLSRRVDDKVNVWCYYPARYDSNAWGTGAEWVVVDVADDWQTGMAIIEQLRNERRETVRRLKQEKGNRR